MAFGTSRIVAPAKAQMVPAASDAAAAAASPAGASRANAGDRISRTDQSKPSSYRDAVATLKASNSTHAAPLSLVNDVGQFVGGFAAGAADGVSGTFSGAAALVKSGYQLATSADARGHALSATIDVAREARALAHGTLRDPATAADQIGAAASGAWNRTSSAYRATAAAGNAAQFVGHALGEAIGAAATAILPGGAVADLAAAGRATHIAAVAVKAEDLAAGAGSAALLAGRGVVEATASSTRELTTAYRVEGAGNQRLIIADDGSVRIPTVTTKSGAERNLYLNFGDEARAKQFLAQRLRSFPDNAIKQFDVPTSFVDELRSTAVPEAERSRNPARPVIADPTKAADQFGLSGSQIERLREVIVPGSGKPYGG